MAYTLHEFPRRGKIGPEIEMRVDNDWHGPCLYNTQETAVIVLMSPEDARNLAINLSQLADKIELAEMQSKQFEDNHPSAKRE